MKAATVKNILDTAPEYTAEPPRALTRELPPADPFPVDALGYILRAAALGIHDRVQAPMAICGQSVLAAATLAVQAHADIELPTTHIRPLSSFLMTVAATGERKSGADDDACRATRRHEKALRDRHDADLPGYLNDFAAWEKAVEFAKKRGKGNRATIRDDLDAIGPAPSPPLIPMLTCPEPTYEGLCRLYMGGQPSLGLFSAEGGQFIGGHGMSDDKKLMTATGLSCLWDGEPIRRVRVGDGASILPGRRLAAHIMAQPDVASVMLSDRVLTDQGLLSRMLVTAPDSIAGTRLWQEPKPESATDLARYEARLLSIFEMPPPLALGKQNELEPRTLPLSVKARSVWIGFTDHIEGEIGQGGTMESIRGLANKLPEHAARLAGVLTLIDDIDAGEVSAEKLAAGIDLAQHYAAEAIRLFAVSRINIKLLLAQRVLVWLQTDWKEPFISLPDIYQLGPTAVRDAATAKPIVERLEEHGWLVKIKGGTTVNGHTRRDAWRIVKGA